MTSAADPVALLDTSLELELRELSRANSRARFHDEADVAWCTGAVPGAVVYRTRLGASSATTAITDQCRRFDAGHLGATWWAGPSDRPDDLRRRLAEANFVLEDDEAGMAADLGALVEDLPVPAGLEVVATGGEDRLDARVIEEWLDVAELTYGWPRERRAQRRTLYLSDERRPRPWRHVVARLNGTAVALARVLVQDGVAMVHGVATVPDSRRHGIGTAVTLRALQVARDAGAAVGVLQASSMGQGPYRHLGFQQVASYGRFVRPAARGQHQA